MVKSQRRKAVSLTKVKKGGAGAKELLIRLVRECVDKYAYLYVFSARTVRNQRLKQMRSDAPEDRFFFGKNKVVALALGRSADEEYAAGLHQITRRLRGEVGLYFTNKTRADAEAFRGFETNDHARAGCVAPSDVTLVAGPLPQFPHSMDVQLRNLGMPVRLVNGIVTLERDYPVCAEGDVLTPEKCILLKHFDIRLATFRLPILCSWASADGTFTRTASDDASDDASEDDDEDDDEEEMDL